MAASEALLLIAHGSARYPAAARPLLRHVEVLRAELPDIPIEVGLLNGVPSVQQALTAMTADRVHAVPFFMEAGYFTRVAIPRALGGDVRVRLCPPVGVHPGMVDIMETQARAGCMELHRAPGETAVLVVGHGSATAPGRALALHGHGAALAARAVFGHVAIACLEEAPLLADALRALGDWPVVVIGFFAGEGLHVRDDVPEAVAAEQQRSARPMIFNGSVMDDPMVRAIIRAQAGLAQQGRNQE